MLGALKNKKCVIYATSAFFHLSYHSHDLASRRATHLLVAGQESNLQNQPYQRIEADPGTSGPLSGRPLWYIPMMRGRWALLVWPFSLPRHWRTCASFQSVSGGGQWCIDWCKRVGGNVSDSPEILHTYASEHCSSRLIVNARSVWWNVCTFIISGPGSPGRGSNESESMNITEAASTWPWLPGVL